MFCHMPCKYIRRTIVVAMVVAALACAYSVRGQQPVSIGLGTAIEVSMPSGAYHEYLLRLESGESAVIVIRQIGVNVVVDLKDPAGKLFDSIDSPTGRNGDEIVEIVAEEGGAYAIGVKP